MKSEFLNNETFISEIIKPILKWMFHFRGRETNEMQLPVSEVIAAFEKHMKFGFDKDCKATFQ